MHSAILAPTFLLFLFITASQSYGQSSFHGTNLVGDPMHVSHMNPKPAKSDDPVCEGHRADIDPDTDYEFVREENDKDKELVHERLGCKYSWLYTFDPPALKSGGYSEIYASVTVETETCKGDLALVKSPIAIGLAKSEFIHTLNRAIKAYDKACKDLGGTVVVCLESEESKLVYLETKKRDKEDRKIYNFRVHNFFKDFSLEDFEGIPRRACKRDNQALDSTLNGGSF